MLGIKTKIFGAYAVLAFTLAEVLIVLGIIGVVAEMTIPTLVQSTQKQVLKTSFMKAYSTMSEALELTKLDLDSNSLNVDYATYNGSTYPHASEFTTAFYSKLKVMGTTAYASNSLNFNKSANAYWLGVGTEMPTNMLPDGSSVDCTICASMINISVDVNGPSKKPNRTGYDIFSFHVDGNSNLSTNDPAWWSLNECNSASSDSYNGLGCSYYAQLDKDPGGSTKGYWNSLN